MQRVFKCTGSLFLAATLFAGCDTVKTPVGLEGSAFQASVAGSTQGPDLPWTSHAAPFEFLFGNHFDTHQQSQVRNKRLKGFFYIKFTGDAGEEGYPAATHSDCDMNPDECVVGWRLRGVRAKATLVDHQAGQHPTWCVDGDVRVHLRKYTHFHWLGLPEHAHDLTIGQEYEGFLLKLDAVRPFYFQHHGGFAVDRGLDAVTHANVIRCEADQLLPGFSDGS